MAGYLPAMASSGSDPEEGSARASRREALKTVAVLLKESGRPFALAGGYAVWARGGPESEHDVDFLIAPEDAEGAATLLAGAGLEVVHPPEDWLFKVYVDGALVDVLHRSAGEPDTGRALDHASPLHVLSVEMPVLAATDLVTHKLAVLDEHYCDVAQVLPSLRALREQVDWGRVREVTATNPFAEAVLLLVDRLGIAPGAVT